MITQSASEQGLRLGKLKSLDRVLRQFLRLNGKSEWLDAGDAPWWYNERATLSVFAGAIWRCGGWAFEEFSTKKANTIMRRLLDRPGRCDITFGIGRHEFLAEAKQCWPTLAGDASGARLTAERYLETACADVRKISSWGPTRIAICFVAPLVHVSKKESASQYVQAFIRQLEDMSGLTVAWTFPKKARHLSPANRNRNYAFPGVAVLIRKAD